MHLPIWFQLVIFPLNVVFSGVVRIRNLLFDCGLFQQKQLSKPVVSIGNLSMGGTGKSPMTAEIANLLIQLGFKVSVLSRGYSRENSKQALRVTPKTSWREGGDEPVMLAKQNPELEVLVGPTRWKAAQESRGDTDLFIIDDGFQHRQLHRDINLLLLDATQPIPPRFLYFPFREGRSGIHRADLIVVTRCPDPNTLPQDLQALLDQYQHIPVFFSNFVMGQVKWHNNQPISPKRVMAFSGIERPEKFFRALEQEGFEVVFSLGLKDHQPLEPQHWEKLQQFSEKENAKALVTTEKDWVKLEKIPNSGIIMGFLPMRVQWREPEKVKTFFKSQINRIGHEKTPRTA